MNEALLVIDVQNEYFTGRLPVTHPAGSLDNILKAMDSAHEGHVPVIVIQHANRPRRQPRSGKGRPGGNSTRRLSAGMPMSSSKKPFREVLPAPLLTNWLQERAIATVTIAGYMTQMCCDTTARQAFHRNYAVNFLADATGTLAITNHAGSISAADLHRAILVTQQQRFARVMTTDEWIMEF